MNFQLGEWSVEENANLLTRGKEKVRVENRVMAVLIQLIAARGGVVTKDALLGTVWKGSVVSDHSVANAVSDLRRVLGDDRRNPRYIETIPKSGYRLLVDAKKIIHATSIDTASSGNVHARVRRPRVAIILFGLFFALAALTAWFWFGDKTQPRILLTDIENATGDRQWDIAGDAAAEMLMVALAGGDHRLVRWRTSVPEGVKSETLFTEIMPLREHDRLLVGRIIIDDEEPVLTLRLIDWEDGASVWAGAYSLDPTRYRALSESIVTDLGEPLGLIDLPRVFSASDSDVFEAYWRARYLWSLREHEAILDAVRILTEVLEEASDFAPAHAALADIYAHKTAEELGLERQETYEIAERHLARAYALDPDLSEVLVTRAYLSFFRDKDSQAAMSQIEKAIALRPENATAWQTKAMIASAAGEVDTSLEAIGHARALDPLSAGTLWDEVWFLYIAKRYDEALEAATRARRVSAPIDVYEALIQMARGDEAAAFDNWLARARKRGLSDQQAEKIEDIMRSQGELPALSALAVSASSDSEYTEHPVPLAALLIALEQDEVAILRLLGDKPREKSWWWSWYSVIPAFDAIRDDPRLESLSVKFVSAPR